VGPSRVLHASLTPLSSAWSVGSFEVTTLFSARRRIAPVTGSASRHLRS